MKFLSNEDKEQIVKEYSVSTIEELAKKYGIGDRRVRTILKENGVEIRNSHIKTTSTGQLPTAKARGLA